MSKNGKKGKKVVEVGGGYRPRAHGKEDTSTSVRVHVISGKNTKLDKDFTDHIVRKLTQSISPYVREEEADLTIRVIPEEKRGKGSEWFTVSADVKVPGRHTVASSVTGALGVYELADKLASQLARQLRKKKERKTDSRRRAGKNARDGKQGDALDFIVLLAPAE
jgi:ribosomal subunit interface protein